MAGRPLKGIDISHIKELLTLNAYNVSRVAKLLGVHRNTIYNHAQRIVFDLAGLRPPRPPKIRRPRGRVPKDIDVSYICETVSSRRVSVARIALELNVHRNTIYNHLQRSASNEWQQIKAILRPRRRRAILTPMAEFYPYLVGESVDGASLIKTINNIVPRGLPEILRADVCQELALAILAGEVDFHRIREEIPKRVRQFRRQYNTAYFSLDAPIWQGEDDTIGGLLV